MLTPAFDLSQDPDFLTIAIRVPYARVSEFDVYFEGLDFKFYAKPYFLRRVPGVWRWGKHVSGIHSFIHSLDNCLSREAKRTRGALLGIITAFYRGLRSRC